MQFRHAGKTRLVAAACLLLACFSASAIAGVPVDLRTWTQRGDAGAGNWNVAADGSNVLQTINGAPTFFVSPNDFYNTTIEGSFRVQTTGDDDFIGFVFGYTSPLEGDPNRQCDFILFDWKQNAQLGAPEGFYLGRIVGTHNGAAGSGNQLWPHNSDANITCTSFGAPLVNDGWADNTLYDFTLDFKTNSIRIDMAGGVFGTGQTIFNLTTVDPNPAGRFGFYNHSQASVYYQSFTQTDDPILATDPDDGGTLDFGPVRVGTDTDGVLQIINTGGPGSSLIGTAASPVSAVFGGPAPDADFTLGPSESTNKTYTYAPLARGTDTETINVASNDPADTDGHDIVLSGICVGPIFGSDTSPGGTLDFGQVNDGESPELILLIDNTTPDPNGGDDTLTDLTLTGATITGDDAAMFRLVGFAPDTAVNQGDSVGVTVAFDAAGDLVPRSALLTVTTDEGTVLGGAGSVFAYDLAGEVVPEPATLALAALGGLGLLIRRWRR